MLPVMSQKFTAAHDYYFVTEKQLSIWHVISYTSDLTTSLVVKVLMMMGQMKINGWSLCSMART